MANKRLKPDAPESAALGVEAAGFEGAFDSGITGMDFGADAADTTLAGHIEKGGDKTTPDALTSPLILNKDRDDIHRLAAKLGAPLVKGVCVTAELALLLGNEYDTVVAGFHSALEDAPGIICCAVGMNLHKQLAGQLAQLVHIFWFCRSNFKRGFSS